MTEYAVVQQQKKCLLGPKECWRKPLEWHCWTPLHLPNLLCLLQQSDVSWQSVKCLQVSFLWSSPLLGWSMSTIWCYSTLQTKVSAGKLNKKQSLHYTKMDFSKSESNIDIYLGVGNIQWLIICRKYIILQKLGCCCAYYLITHQRILIIQKSLSSILYHQTETLATCSLYNGNEHTRIWTFSDACETTPVHPTQPSQTVHVNMRTYEVCHFFQAHLHLMPFNSVMTVRNGSIAMCMLPSKSSAARNKMTMVWSAEFGR